MHFRNSGKLEWNAKLRWGVTSAVAVSLLLPQAAFANIDSWKNQQDQQQQQLEQSRQKENEAREKKEQFQKEITVNAAEINNLVSQISEKETAITALQGDIYQKNLSIEQTQKELAEAEQRVKERDAVLKQRLRMMYEQGEVQYLEVLLSSTSFTDFLDRFDALSIIFQQDTLILKKNKEDRDLVVTTKKKLEDEKSSLVSMKAQQVEAKQQLDGMKAQKVVLNQQLESSKSDQERIEHEQQSIQESAIASIYELQKQIDAEKYRQATEAQKNQNGGGGGAQPVEERPQFNGPWGWPVPASYNITSEFGERIDPFTGQRAGHNGMDIAAPTGTTVIAAQSGTVITAGWVSGFGNVIIIDHGGNLWSLYGHLVDGGILVSKGDEVEKGQTIGKVGSTGRSTGPHLHFAAYLKGQVVNPRNYL